MQKYGVENSTAHFMSFNTICDATQVRNLDIISLLQHVQGLCTSGMIMPQLVVSIVHSSLNLRGY